MDKKFLSIIIPCLNEEKTLPIVLQKCKNAIDRLKLDAEIIVADNGSTDKSIKIATNYGARVVFCLERGYGNTLACGMQSARGKYIVMGDADDSYNFEEIDGFIKYLENGYALVMGSRLKGNIEKGAMTFLHRYLGTPALTWILNLFFGTKISDCNCGMRGLTKEAFDKMKLFSPGMEFASEMIMKAGILKLKIKEIPINFYKDKREQSSYLRAWRDGWRHLRLLILYAPKYIFIIPGFVLFALGLALLFLTFSQTIIFGHKFYYHFSLLGGLLTILGFQTINMGIFAKIYSYAEDYNCFDKFTPKFKKYFSLERGIILGLILFIIGFAIDFNILITWVKSSFGELEKINSATVASILMILGAQIVFSSFFISVLNSKKDD